MKGVGYVIALMLWTSMGMAIEKKKSTKPVKQATIPSTQENSKLESDPESPPSSPEPVPDSATQRYSRYFWQPDKKRQSLKVQGYYMTSNSKAVSGVWSVDSEFNGNKLGVEYMYGISECLSIGAELAYSTGDLKSKTDSSSSITESGSRFEGLNNVALKLSARTRPGALVAYYGLTTWLSPGDSTYDSAEKKGNTFSGGYSVAPYLGVTLPLVDNRNWVGLKVSYLMFGGAKTKNSNPTGETTVDPGNAFSVAFLYEHQTEAFAFLADVGYFPPENIKVTTGMGSTQPDNESYLGGSVGGEYHLSSQTDLLLRVTYHREKDKTVGAFRYESLSSLSMGLGARFVF